MSTSFPIHSIQFQSITFPPPTLKWLIADGGHFFNSTSPPRTPTFHQHKNETRLSCDRRLGGVCLRLSGLLSQVNNNECELMYSGSLQFAEAEAI